MSKNKERQENSIANSIEPYDTIILCGNKIVGGANLFDISGTIPLQIAKGTPPNIWLKTKLKSGGELTFVEDSKSSHPDIEVADIDGKIRVTLGSEKILDLSELDGEVVDIEYLDLRPIGLNIHGDSKAGITVGNSKFVGNTFKGSGTFIGIG
ncbi:hypothetical protein [Maritalea myrionectae]|uniref:hypothetical protein n=1 Tax=Maritalea myrionectae TaxID=454601 RepID=UPI00055B469F|nr:hypothetical protein [Maritalea myrionectae]